MTVFRPTIQIHKQVLEGFKRRAWAAWPVEYIERMLGIATPAGFDVHILTPVSQTASALDVAYDHDLEDIRDAEDVTKTQFLGYIHTHVGSNVCQHFSEEDHLDALKNRELISGVCWIHKSGNKRFTEFHFEIPHAPILLKISNH